MEKEKNDRPQNYFVTGMEDEFEEKPLEKYQPYIDKGHGWMIKIWPTVQRVINTSLYYLLKIIKGAVRIATSQIKSR